MEIVVLLLVGLALFGLLGMFMLSGADKAQKKAEANADTILDNTFNGAPDVTVKVNMETLKYDAYVIGAKQRGYRLAHQAENKYGPHTLIFEKVA